MFFLIIKRILLGLITLIIVSLITFVGTEVLPGDACTTYLEREAYGAALEACYKRLGLDINQEIPEGGSRLSLDSDTNEDLQIRTNNSFLHDNVD